jgi:hypothetical protein
MGKHRIKDKQKTDAVFQKIISSASAPIFMSGAAGLCLYVTEYVTGVRV